jgi:hypothetical protein
MKKCFLSLTAVFLILAILPGCKKEDPIPYPISELPAATQTGENTFGCIINGEPWLAYAPFHLFGKLRATYDETHYGSDYNQRLIVSARRVIGSHDWNNDSISNTLGFTITPIYGNGLYDIQNLDTYSTSFTLSSPGPTKIYRLDTLAPFHIHITKLDTVKKIVSGAFEMDLIEIDDPMDVLQIRHGRFDAWYEEE